MKHPIQPLVKDPHGVLRFQENKIVSYLLEFARYHGTTLNELAVMPFSREDWQQFAQLHGYSLSGYGELSYVDDESFDAAQAMHDNPAISDKDARILVLEEALKAVRIGLRSPIAALYGIHPDDLFDE